MKPGTFVREATARAAAEEGGLSDARLTPELIDLIKKTFLARRSPAVLPQARETGGA